MKTNFFKRFMMPLAVMFLGIAGAFVTMSMSSTESLSQMKGYKYVSPANPCDFVENCTTVFGDLCILPATILQYYGVSIKKLTPFVLEG